MNSSLKYIDLFAGAGGLSEGFIREGFQAVAHIEMDKDACNTLKTRLAYHYLAQNNKLGLYKAYLHNEISREVLWGNVPETIIESVINKEITSKTISDIFVNIDNKLNSHNVDLIIGGPPCQAYSLIGRSRDPNRMMGDKRNYLFRYYAEFLKRYNPKYFVFENVLGLQSAGNSEYLNEMIRLFESIGYSVAEPTVLNAEDYGVLQKRRRVIIMGQRGNKKFNFPELQKVENKWQIKKDLFYDLPYLNPGDECNIVKYTEPANEYLCKTEIRNGIDIVTQHITRFHNERDLEIYSFAIKKWINEKTRLKYSDLPARLQSHKNTEVFLDRFKVVDPVGHSHTMVAHISKDGHYYIYPDLKQIRSISVREASRIQSFLMIIFLRVAGLPRLNKLEMLKINIEMPHKATNMNFIITKTGNAIKALKNNILITENKGDFKYKFRMFDDDGYLYFEGLSKKNSSFIPLDEFGNSYGCTEIHYLKNNSYQRL